MLEVTVYNAEQDYYRQVSLHGNDDFVELPPLEDYEEQCLRDAAERDEMQARRVSERKRLREGSV